MGYLVFACFWKETCMVGRNLLCLNVTEAAGKTKTSLGCEKHLRDSTGFPLVKLSKPSTVFISSASKEEEEILFAAFFHERSPPCSAFYCICSLQNTSL